MESTAGGYRKSSRRWAESIAPPRTRTTYHPAGAGWFTFAGVMFALAGVSNLLWGIGALDDKDYLPKEGLIASNLHLWGWVSIIWGLMPII